MKRLCEGAADGDLPAARAVGAQAAKVGLEPFGGDLGIRWQPRELLRFVGVVAARASHSVASGSADRVGAVTALDGVAVGADRLRFLPCADSPTQDLHSVVFSQTQLRALHRLLPLSLPFGRLSLFGDAALLRLSNLGLQLVEQVP